MQRRFFIRNIALLGFGLGAFPNQLFAAKNQWAVLNLQTQSQVRHGLLNLASSSVLEQNWWETLQKNIFYKNGYEPSEEDLTLYSFRHHQNNYLITLKNKELIIGNGEHLEVFDLDTADILYQDETADLKITVSEGDIAIQQNEDTFVIPILTNTKIDNYILQDREALRMSPKKQTITTNKKILIIKTKKQWTNQQLQVKPLSALT